MVGVDRRLAGQLSVAIGCLLQTRWLDCWCKKTRPLSEDLAPPLVSLPV